MSNKIQHNGGWYPQPESAQLVYIPPGFYDEGAMEDWRGLIQYKISLPALNHLIDYVKREMPQYLQVTGVDQKELHFVIEKLFEQNNKLTDIIKILSNGEPLK